MKRASLVLPIIVILLAASGLAWQYLHQSSLSTEPLFATNLADIAGKPQPLSQWRNQVLLVNFWATWCPPCREEMPELSALAEAYQGKGLQVVGVSTDDLGKMREYALRHPVAYPLLSADMQGMALAEALGNRQGVLPYTVLIDANGKIILSHAGKIDRLTIEQAVSGLQLPSAVAGNQP